MGGGGWGVGGIKMSTCILWGSLGSGKVSVQGLLRVTPAMLCNITKEKLRSVTLSTIARCLLSGSGDVRLHSL